MDQFCEHLVNGNILQHAEMVLLPTPTSQTPSIPDLYTYSGLIRLLVVCHVPCGGVSCALWWDVMCPVVGCHVPCGGVSCALWWRVMCPVVGCHVPCGGVSCALWWLSFLVSPPPPQGCIASVGGLH